MIEQGQHSIITYPLYVMNNYQKFITDRELVLLGHLQVVPSTKRGWEIVADRMGYKSIAPVRTMVGKMAENGVVIVDKYKVNPTPFYNSCLNLHNFSAEVVSPKKKGNPKNKIASQIMGLDLGLTYHQVLNHIKKFDLPEDKILSLYEMVKAVIDAGFFVGTNPNTIASVFAKLQFPIEMDMLLWMRSANKNYTDTKGIPPIPITFKKLTKDSYNWWVQMGKPSEFKPKVREITDIL